jgi:hypothetical protein
MPLIISTTSNKGSEKSFSDGPYVLYRGEKVYANYIIPKDTAAILVIDSADNKEGLLLKVRADEEGKFFTVTLKSKIQNEKAEYRKPTKQLVISDIEGNFTAFRKLLLAAGVMDDNFNWIFGNGHLVLVGDFSDRGDRVIETLWLVYSLEEKAKAAGGYVHFLLGNHEIMNLSGDLRYLHPKYQISASLIGDHYQNLLGENSELGRWLRSKNSMERVGDMLYVHGGISTAVNNIDLSLEKMNELARPWYADSTYNYKYKEEEILMNDEGPFWYRGYYSKSKKATMGQVDSTLEKFRVNHIVTGHTVIADTVSVLFNGKIFDTDVHHAAGKSEALFIEGGRFYRITPSREKFEIARK